MGHIKAKGFVIRVVPVGEADRIIDLLTESMGLITVSVRGARRNRSPHLLTTQLFSFASFELFENKNKYRLNASELITSFQPLQEDLSRLICATHLAEIVIDVTRDDSPQTSVYTLWAFSLHAISNEQDPLLMVHVAQMKLLMQIGFAPYLEGCVICNRTSETHNDYRFSLQAGGLVCSRQACLSRTTDATRLSKGVLDCLLHIQNAPVTRLFRFSIDPGTRESFLAVSEAYLSHQMEKSYTRLRMLDHLDACSKFFTQTE